MRSILFFWTIAFLSILLAKSQTWNSVGSGTSASINVIVADSSNHVLYAGGVFGLAGNDTARFIAQWNGTDWATINNQLGGIGIYALAVYNDELIIGGYFDSLASPGNYILRWNGFQWVTFGSGANAPIGCMVVDDNNDILYVGGDFTSINGIQLNRIAKWDGSNWSSLGGGIEDGGVKTIFVDENGDVFVGGSFSQAGGNLVNSIAKWDGNLWVGLGAGFNNEVDALIKYKDVLYAGGGFTESSGNSVRYLAQWNGTEWLAVPGGPNNAIYALYIYWDELYAGGQTQAFPGMVARWNGNSWSDLGQGIISRAVITSFAEFEGDLYVAGGFDSAGGMQVNNIARWSMPLSSSELPTKAEINFYPIPSGGNTMLFVSTSYPGIIKIFDSQGKLLLTNNISKSTTTLNLSALSPGIYIYRYFTQRNNETITDKILIQK